MISQLKKTIAKYRFFVMSESHWDARKLDKSIPLTSPQQLLKIRFLAYSPSFGGGTAKY
jgi:hypothetical protein